MGLKLKFLQSKENHQQNKKPTEWENIFFNDTTEKALISKIQGWAKVGL